METQKVLRALLDAGWSDRPRLAKSAGVKATTVATVLQRNQSAIEKRSLPSSGRGRPAAQYRIKPDWRAAIEQRLEPPVVSVDPVIAAIEIVEEAEAALRAADTLEVRDAIVKAARLQAEAARTVIENRPDLRLDLELRLVAAEARLNAAAGSSDSPLDIKETELEAARQIASFATIKAASIQPPQSSWERWHERLREVADEFGARWLSARSPDQADEQSDRIAVVIDAVSDEPSSVGAEVVRTLHEAGVPTVAFDSGNFHGSEGNSRFFDRLRDLVSDPVSCLAPVYLTLDSRESYSKKMWSALQDVGDQDNLDEAVRTAREAIIELVQSNCDDVSDDVSFYNAFIKNVEKHSHGPSLGMWGVCRGPALFDLAKSRQLEMHVAQLNCLYVGQAADIDLRNRVLGWWRSSPMARSGESWNIAAMRSIL